MHFALMWSAPNLAETSPKRSEPAGNRQNRPKTKNLRRNPYHQQRLIALPLGVALRQILFAAVSSSQHIQTHFTAITQPFAWPPALGEALRAAVKC